MVLPEYTGVTPDGRKVQINLLLVDNPQAYDPSFDRRYGDLSTDADLIVYNGHAALGGNVRAMTKKGKWKPGKFVIVYMNGCDSFAYVDGYLAQARSILNPDDPTGTRYLDMITNALPANPTWFPPAMASLINNLIDVDKPRTYQSILKEFERDHMAVVTGDEDNVFAPGMPIVPGVVEPAWDGIESTGSVARNEEHFFATEELPRGSYVFRITGTGDADLYVRVGEAPTTSAFDCRPYVSGSTESCTIDLSAPAAVHVMVRGWAASSTYQLRGMPADKADDVMTGEQRTEETRSESGPGCSVQRSRQNGDFALVALIGILVTLGLRRRRSC